ncbi:unnamed protein product [Rotaria sp. Silwood2]|nr:unnamed protein product [Rotaria sp. Silwood2]
MMKAMTIQDNANQVVLNGKKASYTTNINNQRRSSCFQWTESFRSRFLNGLCCCWINPIIFTAYQRKLTVNDLSNIPYIDKASVLLHELYSYKWLSITTWNIIWKKYWKDYIYSSLFLIPILITNIAQPLLFRQILLNMMNENGSNTVSYLYAILLVIAVNIKTFTHRQHLFSTDRLGLRMTNALTMIIYKRALSLKSTSLKEFDTGQIINLIANDASKFEEMCKYFSYLFEGIIEIIIIFGLLCWIIKPIPALCGYALFPLFILIQLYFSQKFSQYHQKIIVCTDKRLQSFSEFIRGCHIVKFYNWQKPLEDRIIKMRENEFINIRYASHFRAFNSSLFYLSGSLFAFFTFGSAWLLGYPLSIENTFPTLSLFSILRLNSMYHIPLAIEKLSIAKAASKRIDVFMNSTMEQNNHYQLFTGLNYKQKKGSIFISNASFSWHNDTPCLTLSDLTIEQGTFVGIFGAVGSGKSSLFAAILGEMNLINGQLNINNDSSISYCAQSPWIFEDTFRNNILLNRPFNHQRYNDVMYACCLDIDLNQFGPNYDLIMIGENGFNLSGGQKARLSLARALYTDADIYLLDDPLSSVDHKVAKQIYERCFGPFGLLKNKTRLLATHQIQYLSESHKIICLSHGYIDKQSNLNINIVNGDNTNRNEASLVTSLIDDNIKLDDSESSIAIENSTDEYARWHIWYKLFTAPPYNCIGFCLLVVLLLLGEAFSDGTSYWLSLSFKQSQTNQEISSETVYIYFGLIITSIILDICHSNYYFLLILNGSNSLHNRMLKGLLYTSIKYFETNSSGRILNRASKDQYVIDELLPGVLWEGIKSILIVIGSLFIICLIDLSLFLIFLLLIPPIWWTIYVYRRCSRRLKQLETITRSPVYALFSSSLNGLTTIRSLKAENTFIQSIANRIDLHTSAYLAEQATTHWFSSVLFAVGSLILLVTSIRILHGYDYENASSVALTLMTAMHISVWFQWAVRQFCEADIMMVSGERIDEYAHLPSEDNGGRHERFDKTPTNWPTHGKIEFINYSLRHQFNTEYALKNINLYIKPGEKIGIIGRTGAGKSSLVNGILRLVNRSCIYGNILIDDIDISRITLNHLRSHISVIPQQPILFSGTLRYNLDPFDHYTDEQCWTALEDVQFKKFVKSHSDGLLMCIAEWGKNLSMGQCQLVCIARAILKKSKILLIDEATANVDQETDNLIQEVLKNKFQNQTILTIAHRLNTVAQYDRILVLDKGIILSFDTPMNILQPYRQQSSKFLS